MMVTPSGPGNYSPGAGTLFTNNHAGTTALNLDGEYRIQPIIDPETTPSWSLNHTIGVTVIADLMAFYPANTQSGGTCTNNGIEDGSAGTSGNTPTSSDLQSSTHGLDPSFYYNVSGSALKYASGSYPALLNTAPFFCYGDASYSDQTSMGFGYNTTTGGDAYPTMYLPNWTGSQATYSKWVYLPNIPTSTSFSLQDTVSVGTASDYLTAEFNGSGSALQECWEGPTGGSGQQCQTVTGGNWYIVNIQLNKGGTYYGRLYNSSGSQLGSTFSSASGGSYTPSAVQFGDINPGSWPTGYTVSFGKGLVCLTGSCPLGVLP
jgi:hypothetical protein